ncbi:PepSY-associated TM helix domain-containing protein [Luteibacter yeojuensis]|uniref:Iron-regulated membrane protein n=1 Tax=Luteibacter yeojuensis TaxID=345309 RepID=A0A0F3KV00_9GAMM|nr:PepSY-associated TM helix domain-containing protein [Luteibacter yeojuensis]KJV34787.1 hypothetical protein VI08_09375 [Luteibacter yeojuensis]
MWVRVHRWAGLFLTGFLLIAGLTGALLPFEESLTFATRPDRAWARPGPDTRLPLDGITIAERVERALPVSVPRVELDIPHDHVVRMFVLPAPGKGALPYDVVWADPYTGAVRLTYKWGGVTDGAQNIIPFLFALHYGRLFGPLGETAFGIAALVWTIDCFIGLYLTFPPRRQGGLRRTVFDWWTRWTQAWTVRTGHATRMTFDVHRASGLWLWPLLLVFAWSATALSLPQVEVPVRLVFGGSEGFAPALLAAPRPSPALSRRQALTAASEAFTRLARDHHFALLGWQDLTYLPGAGAYRLAARTSLDRADTGGQTDIWIDGEDGRMLGWAPPLGNTATDHMVAWANLLHMAQVFGLPYRLFVSALGVTLCVLVITGVIIWSKKRAGSRKAKVSRTLTHPPPPT